MVRTTQARDRYHLIGVGFRSRIGEATKARPIMFWLSAEELGALSQVAADSRQGIHLHG
ncbi:hypothetical protein PAHAL_9G093800 [Panicum hallii]|uniref:Uncharacterized protein n=1 Tax=Panicum hallii TaxID=206008 RepID=A0A2T8I0P0_9POAL|nr:hypothetical protein PAHAL_9G093800 [Panicum hallii]